MMPATMSWLAALTVWPGAGRPDVHDRLADRVEDRRRGRSKSAAAPPTMIDSDGVDGALLAAGDRRVEHPEAALGALGGQLGRDVRADAARSR